MSFSANTRLGNYELLGPLGAGGMGEVYRARDLRLGREVALKVLPSDLAASAERLARFEQEARTVAGLNHPNIVTLHAVEEIHGVRFLVMELVEGQTLASVVTPGGIPLPRLLEIALPLADALAAAHERGVVHRDLKPGNVMLTREGRVKVLDFGLAKITAAPELGATTAGPLSTEGQVVGTVSYMAPEQLKGEPLDARTDLFALGIVLYELATGRSPFPGSSAAEVTSSILRDTPEPLQRVRPDLPIGLARLLTRCLEKDPRDRIPSALDVANALRRVERAEEGPIDSSQLASIAVLPFVNRSADADDEYFSDGLADELLHVLSKIQGLRVIARASSFQFRGSTDDVATIGRKLDVASLLEGSVRKAGERVRISVQLVRIADGSTLWSETYDRTLDDIFAVQDEIAQCVVKELRTKLLGEAPKPAASGRAEVEREVALAARGRGADPEAQRLYLQALHALDRYTRDDTAKAVACLKQALSMDPRFAAGWRQLGRAYASQAAQGWTPATQGYEEARQALVRALSLEPDLAEAHVALGWIRMAHDWDFRGAEASYAQALGLEPRNATVLRGAGVLALTLGRVEEGVKLYRRALEQDPLSSATFNNLGIALRAADRLAEAEEAYRKALELAPQRVGTHASLALAILAQGRADEALNEAMREPDEAWRLWALAIVHDGLARPAESDAALRELSTKHGADTAHQIAEAHAARGEKSAAFEWLERAYGRRDGGLMDVRTSPYLRTLHGDPRWGAFLEKMRVV